MVKRYQVLRGAEMKRENLPLRPIQRRDFEQPTLANAESDGCGVSNDCSGPPSCGE